MVFIGNALRGVAHHVAEVEDTLVANGIEVALAVTAALHDAH